MVLANTATQPELTPLFVDLGVEELEPNLNVAMLKTEEMNGRLLSVDLFRGRIAYLGAKDNPESRTVHFQEDGGQVHIVKLGTVATQGSDTLPGPNGHARFQTRGPAKVTTVTFHPLVF